MLQEFKVRNFKNFRDELCFSLKTTKNYEFNRNIVENGIIRDCLVIGENASGKTNLGYAILDLTSHLTDKEKREVRWSPNYFNSDDTAYFEYVFRFDESTVRYSYEKKQPDRLRQGRHCFPGFPLPPVCLRPAQTRSAAAKKAAPV